jgi:hypothetical protein
MAKYEHQGDGFRMESDHPEGFEAMGLEPEESGHLRSEELPCDYCGAEWVEVEDTNLSTGRTFRGIVMDHKEDCAYILVDSQQWVTAYAITRHYGGPEEGGWWWNNFEAIETVGPFQTEAHAEEAREELKAKHAGVVTGDIYSVSGGVALYVGVEDSPRESETTERPHYA